MDKKALVEQFLDKEGIRESFEWYVNKFYEIGEENQGVSAARDGEDIFFESVSHYIDVVEVEDIFLCMGSWIYADEGYEFWSYMNTKWMDHIAQIEC